VKEAFTPAPEPVAGDPDYSQPRTPFPAPVTDWDVPLTAQEVEEAAGNPGFFHTIGEEIATRKGLVQKIPWYGQLPDATKTIRAWQAVQRLKKSEYTDPNEEVDDLRSVTRFFNETRIRQKMDENRSFWGKAVSYPLRSIPFAGEILMSNLIGRRLGFNPSAVPLMTGGAESGQIAMSGTRAGIVKLLNRFIGENGEKMIADRLKAYAEHYGGDEVMGLLKKGGQEQMQVWMKEARSDLARNIVSRNAGVNMVGRQLGKAEVDVAQRLLEKNAMLRIASRSLEIAAHMPLIATGRLLAAGPGRQLTRGGITQAEDGTLTFNDTGESMPESVLKGLTNEYFEYLSEFSGGEINKVLKGGLRHLTSLKLADLASRLPGKVPGAGKLKLIMGSKQVTRGMAVAGRFMNKAARDVAINDPLSEYGEEVVNMVGQSVFNLDDDGTPWSTRVVKSLLHPVLQPKEAASMILGFSLLPVGAFAVGSVSGQLSDVEKRANRKWFDNLVGTTPAGQVVFQNPGQPRETATAAISQLRAEAAAGDDSSWLGRALDKIWPSAGFSVRPESKLDYTMRTAVRGNIPVNQFRDMLIKAPVKQSVEFLTHALSTFSDIVLSERIAGKNPKDQDAFKLVSGIAQRAQDTRELMRAIDREGVFSQLPVAESLSQLATAEEVKASETPGLPGSGRAVKSITANVSVPRMETMVTEAEGLLRNKEVKATPEQRKTLESQVAEWKSTIAQVQQKSFQEVAGPYVRVVTQHPEQEEATDTGAFAIKQFLTPRQLAAPEKFEHMRLFSERGHLQELSPLLKGLSATHDVYYVPNAGWELSEAEWRKRGYGYAKEGQRTMYAMRAAGREGGKARIYVSNDARAGDILHELFHDKEAKASVIKGAKESKAASPVRMVAEALLAFGQSEKILGAKTKGVWSLPENLSKYLQSYFPATVGEGTLKRAVALKENLEAVAKQGAEAPASFHEDVANLAALYMGHGTDIGSRSEVRGAQLIHGYLKEGPDKPSRGLRLALEGIIRGDKFLSSVHKNKMPEAEWQTLQKKEPAVPAKPADIVVDKKEKVVAQPPVSAAVKVAKPAVKATVKPVVPPAVSPTKVTPAAPTSRQAEREFNKVALAIFDAAPDVKLPPAFEYGLENAKGKLSQITIETKEGKASAAEILAQIQKVPGKVLPGFDAYADMLAAFTTLADLEKKIQDAQRKLMPGQAPAVEAKVVNWDSLESGQLVTLYRGENAENRAGGPWWTTDEAKAARYGKVTSVKLSTELIVKWAARGDKGNDEFVFLDKGPVELSKEKIGEKPKAANADIQGKPTDVKYKGPTRLAAGSDMGEVVSKLPQEDWRRKTNRIVAMARILSLTNSLPDNKLKFASYTDTGDVSLYDLQQWTDDTGLRLNVMDPELVEAYDILKDKHLGVLRSIMEDPANVWMVKLKQSLAEQTKIRKQLRPTPHDVELESAVEKLVDAFVDAQESDGDRDSDLITYEDSEERNKRYWKIEDEFNNYLNTTFGLDRLDERTGTRTLPTLMYPLSVNRPILRETLLAAVRSPLTLLRATSVPADFMKETAEGAPISAAELDMWVNHLAPTLRAYTHDELKAQDAEVNLADIIASTSLPPVMGLKRPSRSEIKKYAKDTKEGKKVARPRDTLELLNVNRRVVDKAANVGMQKAHAIFLEAFKEHETLKKGAAGSANVWRVHANKFKAASARFKDMSWERTKAVVKEALAGEKHDHNALREALRIVNAFLPAEEVGLKLQDLLDLVEEDGIHQLHEALNTFLYHLDASTHATDSAKKPATPQQALRHMHAAIKGGTAGKTIDGQIAWGLIPNIYAPALYKKFGSLDTQMTVGSRQQDARTGAGLSLLFTPTVVKAFQKLKLLPKGADRIELAALSGERYYNRARDYSDSDRKLITNVTASQGAYTPEGNRTFWMDIAPMGLKFIRAVVRVRWFKAVELQEAYANVHAWLGENGGIDNIMSVADFKAMFSGATSVNDVNRGNWALYSAILGRVTNGVYDKKAYSSFPKLVKYGTQITLAGAPLKMTSDPIGILRIKSPQLLVTPAGVIGAEESKSTFPWADGQEFATDLGAKYFGMTADNTSSKALVNGVSPTFQRHNLKANLTYLNEDTMENMDPALRDMLAWANKHNVDFPNDPIHVVSIQANMKVQPADSQVPVAALAWDAKGERLVFNKVEAAKGVRETMPSESVAIVSNLKHSTESTWQRPNSQMLAGLAVLHDFDLVQRILFTRAKELQSKLPSFRGTLDSLKEAIKGYLRADSPADANLLKSLNDGVDLRRWPKFHAALVNLVFSRLRRTQPKLFGNYDQTVGNTLDSGHTPQIARYLDKTGKVLEGQTLVDAFHDNKKIFEDPADLYANVAGAREEGQTEEFEDPSGDQDEVALQYFWSRKNTFPDLFQSTMHRDEAGKEYVQLERAFLPDVKERMFTVAPVQVGKNWKYKLTFRGEYVLRPRTPNSGPECVTLFRLKGHIGKGKNSNWAMANDRIVRLAGEDLDGDQRFSYRVARDDQGRPKGHGDDLVGADGRIQLFPEAGTEFTEEATATLALLTLARGMTYLNESRGYFNPDVGLDPHSRQLSTKTFDKIAKPALDKIDALAKIGYNHPDLHVLATRLAGDMNALGAVVRARAFLQEVIDQKIHPSRELNFTLAKREFHWGGEITEKRAHLLRDTSGDLVGLVADTLKDLIAPSIHVTQSYVSLIYAVLVSNEHLEALTKAETASKDLLASVEGTIEFLQSSLFSPEGLEALRLGGFSSDKLTPRAEPSGELWSGRLVDMSSLANSWTTAAQWFDLHRTVTPDKAKRFKTFDDIFESTHFVFDLDELSKTPNMVRSRETVELAKELLPTEPLVDVSWAGRLLKAMGPAFEKAYQGILHNDIWGNDNDFMRILTPMDVGEGRTVPSISHVALGEVSPDLDLEAAWDKLKHSHQVALIINAIERGGLSEEQKTGSYATLLPSKAYLWLQETMDKLQVKPAPGKQEAAALTSPADISAPAEGTTIPGAVSSEDWMMGRGIPNVQSPASVARSKDTEWQDAVEKAKSGQPLVLYHWSVIPFRGTRFDPLLSDLVHTTRDLGSVLYTTPLENSRESWVKWINLEGKRWERSAIKVGKEIIETRFLARLKNPFIVKETKVAPKALGVLGLSEEVAKKVSELIDKSWAGFPLVGEIGAVLKGTRFVRTEGWLDTDAFFSALGFDSFIDTQGGQFALLSRSNYELLAPAASPLEQDVKETDVTEAEIQRIVGKAPDKLSMSMGEAEMIHRIAEKLDPVSTLHREMRKRFHFLDQMVDLARIDLGKLKRAAGQGKHDILILEALSFFIDSMAKNEDGTWNTDAAYKAKVRLASNVTKEVFMLKGQLDSHYADTADTVEEIIKKYEAFRKANPKLGLSSFEDLVKIGQPILERARRDLNEHAYEFSDSGEVFSDIGHGYVQNVTISPFAPAKEIAALVREKLNAWYADKKRTGSFKLTINPLGAKELVTLHKIPASLAAVSSHDLAMDQLSPEERQREISKWVTQMEVEWEHEEHNRMVEMSHQAEFRKWTLEKQFGKFGRVLRNPNYAVSAENYILEQSDFVSAKRYLSYMANLTDGAGIPSAFFMGIGDKKKRDAQKLLSPATLRKMFDNWRVQLVITGSTPAQYDYTKDIWENLTLLESVADKDWFKLHGYEKVELIDKTEGFSHAWVLKGATRKLLDHVTSKGIDDLKNEGFQGFLKWVLKKLIAFNMLTKQLALSISFFHAATLMESHVSSYGLNRRNPLLNPWKFITEIRDVWRTSQNALTDPAQREAMSKWMEDGLTFRFSDRDPLENLDPRDEGGPLDKYLRQGLEFAEKNAAVKYTLGAGLKAAQVAKKFGDHLLWEVLQPASKLMMAERTFAEILNNPDYDHLTSTAEGRALIRKDIAQVTNQAFGGLEWREMVWATPMARDIMRALVFAPDWTFANLQMAMVPDLLQKVSGVKMPFGPMAETDIRSKFLIEKNWPAFLYLTLMLVPAMWQAAIYYAFGHPDDGDEPLMFLNEEGKEFSVDISPVMRKLGKKYGVTEKRRAYLQWGKSGYEVGGWFANPLKTALGKSSMGVKVAWEQLTGRNSAGWDMPWAKDDVSVPFGGLFMVDGSLMKSRMGYVAQKFVPMTLLTYLDANRPSSLFAPTGLGMSQYKAERAIADILQAYGDESFWYQIKGKPEKVKRLETLVNSTLDAAWQNGYEVKKIMAAARGMAHGRQATEFFAELEKDPKKPNLAKLEKIARAAQRTDTAAKSFNRAIEGRYAKRSRDMTRNQRQALWEAWQVAQEKRGEEQ
jgi:hypothetical protein